MSASRRWLIVCLATIATIISYLALNKAGAHIGWWAVGQPWYQKPVPWDYMNSFTAFLGCVIVAYAVGRVVSPGRLWGALPCAMVYALFWLASIHLARRHFQLGPHWATSIIENTAVTLAACALFGHMGDLVSRGGAARRVARCLVAALAGAVIVGSALAQVYYRPVTVDPGLEQAIVAGDWQQVIDRAKAWQQRDPDSLVPARVISCAYYYRLREPAQAHEASIPLGNAERNGSPKALACVQWAHILVAHQPNNAHAWELLAAALSGVHLNDAALEAASNAVRLAPDDPVLYDVRANVHAEKRQYDDAIADCTKAITLDPQDANAFGRRGWAFERKGDRDKAIADYTTAIALNPHHFGAYCTRSKAFSDRGEHDKAVADATRAVEVAPNLALTWYYKGMALKSAGRTAEATEVFSQTASIAAKTGEEDVAAWVQEQLHKPNPTRTEAPNYESRP
jgi:tetratricopeptide (TPR) repeat protein